MSPDDGRAMGMGEALARYLARAGLAERLHQATVLEEWPSLVGAQIAQVTEPVMITKDGTLFVRVATASWAQELQMQTPMVLARLREGGRRVTKIVWRAG